MDYIKELEAIMLNQRVRVTVYGGYSTFNRDWDCEIVHEEGGTKLEVKARNDSLFAAVEEAVTRYRKIVPAVPEFSRLIEASPNDDIPF